MVDAQHRYRESVHPDQHAAFRPAFEKATPRFRKGSEGEKISIDPQRRWCVFTSAGDRNAIHRWLEGHAPRRWDLVTAYYGNNDHTFLEIKKFCIYAFRAKGSKFQNLKKLVLQHPKFFDRYSHVWVCDDDILMSGTQINEAFELTETLGFWIAQPATRAEGKNGHWITCFAGPQWDYRIVNFVEVNLPIFRLDKLKEFLDVYDGSLVGWGIDHWYANLFKANEFGRFAIFDRVQVINPKNQDKGGRNEIEILRPASLRAADWNIVRKKLGMVEYFPKIFAYCKLAPERELLRAAPSFLEEEYPSINPAWWHVLRRLRLSGLVRLIKAGLLVKSFLEIAWRSGWHKAIFSLECWISMRRQRQAVGRGFEIQD